jgi:hypothetical protein
MSGILVSFGHRLRRTAPLLRPSAYLMASLLFATLVACAVLGPSVIDPRNIKWLKGDPAQHYLGWAFFRMEDSWRLPLGYTSKLSSPDGTPVAYTDSMPIIAAAMKVFSRHLPSTFQYLGLVGLANYILQALFGYKIGFALLKDRLLAALASAFFTLAPPFVLRTGFHFSLSSQWLILASLWLYIRFDQEEARSSERATVFWFCVLFLFAGGVTPYLGVICLLVCLATGLLAFTKTRRNWLLRTGLWLAPPVVLLVSWMLFGFLKLHIRAEEYATTGYRYHSLNLLAPFDPQKFSSLLFKDQGVFPGQTEGYSYLGGGIIFLIVVSLIFAPLSLFRSKIVSLWPLWLVAVLSFALAASAKITLGPHVLLDFPLPDTLERLFSTFRASGRLFWAGYYIILCCSLAAASQIFSRSRLVVVLAALLLVQILDCKSLYAEVHKMLNSRPGSATRLKDPFWKQIGKRFDTLIVLPAFQSQFRLRTYDSPAGDDNWRLFGMLAAKQKMAINTAYLARHEAKPLEYQLKTLPRLICSGQFDEKTLCILSPRFLVRLLENGVTDVFCQTVDGVAVCWKAPSKSEENWNSILNALHEKGYLVSLLDRFAYHPHEVAMDLRQGFRLPEGTLLLADGPETQIPLLLDQARPVKRIHVDLTPLNVPDESSRPFSVRIGQHQAGNWNLKSRSTVAVEIPDQAWKEGSFTRRIVPLVFKWEGQTSSDAASDAQPAAAGFRELRLEY